MKILCICPIGIGNYILCYPAWARLKQSLPDASLTLLGLRTSIADIARGDALWDDIVLFDPTKLKGKIGEQVRIIGQIRNRTFDVSLSFFPSNTWQYNLLPLLCGIPIRWNFDYIRHGKKALSFLNTNRQPVDVSLHDVTQNLAIVDVFTGKKSTNAPIFPRLFGDSDAAWVENLIVSIGENKRYIGIHAGSSADHGMDAKRWAPDRFTALADRLCEKFGLEALIFGGKEESDLKEQIATTMRQPSHNIEPQSLAKTAAIIDQCALMLCNDSGLMHMAACQNVPTIAIFGPTDELRNGPFGECTLVVRKKMDGFPVWTAASVGDRKLPDGVDPMASLKALTVDDAWVQIASWLESETVRKSLGKKVTKDL